MDEGLHSECCQRVASLNCQFVVTTTRLELCREAMASLADCLRLLAGVLALRSQHGSRCLLR